MEHKQKRLARAEAEKDLSERAKDKAVAQLEEAVKRHAAERATMEQEAEKKVKEAERSVREEVASQTTPCPEKPTAAPCPSCKPEEREKPVVMHPPRSARFANSQAKRNESPKDSVAIHIVTHVHWDREWYRSLEHFTRLLATIVDNVVNELTAPRTLLEHFHLDSQAALVEDYLRARPERKETLQRLVQANRFGAGPWYTQPDEFLVSGEALVRNLLYGIATLADLNMDFVPVGHVPDQFGHTSQMPQIFAQFGMVAASSMRGVPNSAHRNSWWVGPDGTRMLLMKFSNYCGIQFDESSSLLKGRKKKRAPLLDQVQQQLTKRAAKDKSENVSTLYLLNGCDHRDLDQQVGEAIRGAQEQSATRMLEFGYRNVSVREVVSSNLRDVALLVLDEIKSNNYSLPTLKGELRNDVDHLADTISSGMSLKRRNWASEELLQSWAEPLNVAVGLRGKQDESTEIVRAWKLVLENHFHDTICTSSIPQVLVEAKARAERAIQIAEAISSQHMFALMESVTPINLEAVFVFNPTNVERRLELNVFWMAIPRSIIIDAGQIVTVTDVLTRKSFNATAVSFDANVWCFRHKRGGFRSQHTFNVLKMAMRPPLVRPNEMRLFRVSLNPEYGPAATLPPVTVHERRRKPKPVEAQEEEKPEEGEEEPKSLGRFGNKLMECEIMRDGSLMVASKTGEFVDVPRLNMLLVQEDFGTQYLAGYGIQIGPFKVEELKFSRTAEFEMASFRLRGLNIKPREVETSDSMLNKRPPQKLLNFELGVHYVLPEDSKQIWVRVTFDNPEGGSRNFAIRVAHKLSCDAESLVNDMAFDHVRRARDSMPATKPFHRWLLASGANCSLGVAGRGLYDSSFMGNRLLMTTLMRSVDRMGDWAAFVNEGAQDFGHHDFEYALVPMGAKSNVAAMAIEGRKFSSESCPVQHVDQGLLPQVMLTCVRSSHLSKLASKRAPFVYGERTVGDDDTAGGLFGPSKTVAIAKKIPEMTLMGGVTVAPESLVLSAVKRAHYEVNAFVVRVYNPSKTEIKGQVKLQHAVAAAFRSQLDESKMERYELSEGDTAVEVTVPPKKIVTLLVVAK